MIQADAELYSSTTDKNFRVSPVYVFKDRDQEVNNFKTEFWQDILPIDTVTLRDEKNSNILLKTFDGRTSRITPSRSWNHNSLLLLFLVIGGYFIYKEKSLTLFEF